MTPNDLGTLDIDSNVVLRGAVLHIRLVNVRALRIRLLLTAWLLCLIGMLLDCYIVFDKEDAEEGA